MPCLTTQGIRAAKHILLEHGHGEAREVDHVVHGIILEVEAPRGARRLLTVRLGEMPVGVCIRARRSNMGRVENIGVDKLELYQSVSRWPLR